MSKRARKAESDDGCGCEVIARDWLEQDMCGDHGVSAEPEPKRVASLAHVLRTERSHARRGALDAALKLLADTPEARWGAVLSKLRDREPVIAPAPPRAPRPLQEEYETYKRLKPSLLETAKGRHVLIKGRELLGVFDDMASAYRSGLKRLGNVPMLIHKVVEVEPVYRIY